MLLIVLLSSTIYFCESLGSSHNQLLLLLLLVLLPPPTLLLTTTTTTTTSFCWTRFLFHNCCRLGMVPKKNRWGWLVQIFSRLDALLVTQSSAAKAVKELRAMWRHLRKLTHCYDPVFIHCWGNGHHTLCAGFPTPEYRKYKWQSTEKAYYTNVYNMHSVSWTKSCL